MTGVGFQSTKQTLEFIDDVVAAGADYVLCLPAYFRKATTPDVVKGFFEVAMRSLLPVVIYNFPGVCNGVDLDSEIAYGNCGLK